MHRAFFLPRSGSLLLPFHSSPPQVVLSGPVLGETWPPPCPGIPTNLNTNGHLRPHPPLFPVFRIKLSASKAAKYAESGKSAKLPFSAPVSPQILYDHPKNPHSADGLSHFLPFSRPWTPRPPAPHSPASTTTCHFELDTAQQKKAFDNPCLLRL